MCLSLIVIDLRQDDLLTFDVHFVKMSVWRTVKNGACQRLTDSLTNERGSTRNMAAIKCFQELFVVQSFLRLPHRQYDLNRPWQFWKKRPVWPHPCLHGEEEERKKERGRKWKGIIKGEEKKNKKKEYKENNRKEEEEGEEENGDVWRIGKNAKIK